ncbi:hypothetical protein MRX96_013960 [Rhipicephalus microplus]
MVSGSSLRRQYVAVFLICVSLAVFLFLNNGFPPIAVRLPAWFPESAFTNVTAGEPVTILFWTPTFGSWYRVGHQRWVYWNMEAPPKQSSRATG